MMVVQKVINFYAGLSGDTLAKALMSMGLVSGGIILILILWISLLYRIIDISEGQKSWQKFLLATVFIPYLNLLWIPWALIAGNAYIKKVQMKYIHTDTLNPAMGARILSIPLLVLYLFWAVLFCFFHRNITANLSPYDVALYLGVIIFSMLILVGFYLVYLVLLVNKIRIYKQLTTQQHARSKENSKAR